MPNQRMSGARALADEDSYELVVPDNSGVSTVPVPAVEMSFAASAGRGAFTLKPPPPRRGRGGTPRAAASALAMRRPPQAASLEDAPTGTDDTQASDVYQLSPAKPDSFPDSVEVVSVAQALGVRPRKIQTSAMAVVEIASAIAGAAMTRVLDNTGDVSWELDQMPRDAVHPNAATSSPSSAAWQRTTIPIEGFWVENGLTQRTYADFEVSFSYNGASVGFVEVSTTGTGDGWGWGLVVKENLTQDPQSYTDRSTGSPLAALKLRFHYRFDRSLGSDSIGIQDLTLFGNGGHAFSERWTQS